MCPNLGLATREQITGRRKLQSTKHSVAVVIDY